MWSKELSYRENNKYIVAAKKNVANYLIIFFSGIAEYLWAKRLSYLWSFSQYYTMCPNFSSSMWKKKWWQKLWIVQKSFLKTFIMVIWVIKFPSEGYNCILLKFMFSKKATKIDKIFTVNLTGTSYYQIDGEDFVNFRGLLRKREL